MCKLYGKRTFFEDFPENLQKEKSTEILISGLEALTVCHDWRHTNKVEWDDTNTQPFSCYQCLFVHLRGLRVRPTWCWPLTRAVWGLGPSSVIPAAGEKKVWKITVCVRTNENDVLNRYQNQVFLIIMESCLREVFNQFAGMLWWSMYDSVQEVWWPKEIAQSWISLLVCALTFRPTGFLQPNVFWQGNYF